MLARVRELRQHGTTAERIVWELLRDRRFLEVKFRRQHQFGSYILDFYSAEKSVAIELDGVGHCTPEQQEHDWIRDNYLRDRGVTVVRISNRELFDNTEEALRRIAVALSPSP